LQRDSVDACGDGPVERPTGSKCEKGGGVTRGHKGIREKHGLSLGTAATEVVLNQEDFHCGRRGWSDGSQLTR
jgi:hypothetical protein